MVLDHSGRKLAYSRLRVEDAEGRADTGTSYFVVAGGQPRIPDYDKENTAWVERAIVYGVIPRKFGDPAFQAVTFSLTALRALSRMNFSVAS